VNAEVITQYGLYQCAACGQALQFEPCKIITLDEFAIGACQNGHDCWQTEHMASNCRMWNVRLKIPLTRLSCEIIEEPIPIFEGG
jgi:hypothetical protein